MRATPRRWHYLTARWTWAGSNWARFARCISWAGHPAGHAEAVAASADIAVVSADVVAAVAVAIPAAWRAPCRRDLVSCQSLGCGCA